MSHVGFFISYSRADSEFALRLAKDLRSAGADIWLDRLDLVPGRPWDDEIQAALESCEGLLAVLSPASVESGNFKDEYFYALEKKKAVIPLLVGECNVPIRLRRLHRVDFTAGYEAGFEKLHGALASRGAIATEQALSSEGSDSEAAQERRLSELAARYRRVPKKPKARSAFADEMRRDASIRWQWPFLERALQEAEMPRRFCAAALLSPMAADLDPIRVTELLTRDGSSLVRYRLVEALRAWAEGGFAAREPRQQVLARLSGYKDRNAHVRGALDRLVSALQ